MKKALLFVLALIALQTMAYADCSKCNKIGCKKPATYTYCDENCRGEGAEGNMTACDASHTKAVRAAEVKAAAEAEIHRDAEDVIAHAGDDEAE